MVVTHDDTTILPGTHSSHGGATDRYTSYAISLAIGMPHRDHVIHRLTTPRPSKCSTRHEVMTALEGSHPSHAPKSSGAHPQSTLHMGLGSNCGIERVVITTSEAPFLTYGLRGLSSCQT